MGLDGIFRADDDGTGLLRATKGRWLTESRFQIVSRSILEGIVTTLTFSFHDDQVDVEIEDNRGVRGRLQGEAKG